MNSVVFDNSKSMRMTFFEDVHVCSKHRSTRSNRSIKRVTTSSPSCRHRPRPRSGGAFIALTVGVALANAVRAAASANPTTPHTAITNGEDRRWASWTRPPPGPPPDPPLPRAGNGSINNENAAGGENGSIMTNGRPGMWVGRGAASTTTGEEKSAHHVPEMEGKDGLSEACSMSGVTMGQETVGQARSQGHDDAQQQRLSQLSQQSRYGNTGTGQQEDRNGGGGFEYGINQALGSRSRGTVHATGPPGDGPNRYQHQQSYHPYEQAQVQSSTPSSWGPEQMPPPPPPPPPPSPPSASPQDLSAGTPPKPIAIRDHVYNAIPESGGSYHQIGPPGLQQTPPSGTPLGQGGMGMGSEREQRDVLWESPPASRVGAITPDVTLNQYRKATPGNSHREGSADGLTGEGGASAGNIPRALLSNTDKEVVFDGLKKLYRKKILPLEESSRFAHFQSPPMNPADFDAKPMVLIVGQYSVGKTSFIRSLLKRDFPGQRVGPEPTTDRFVAVTHGEDERVMPGHALAMQADKPFRSLQQFGNNFLTKFEGSVVDAPILRNITLVDTPGVLSGEKQRIGRDYDFAAVISWFAERADLIVVMFDAHKLDISDELKMVIDTLKPHHDKMRVLLNKADTIDTQQLMRVYGALMWSLGKVMQTPEVCRVYIGSFWEAPLSNRENRLLLEREKNDLLDELMLLPENAVVRRINELVKRARSVKVHAYIIHYLRKQMPYVMGKQDKQEKLIRRLDQEFLACARRYSLPLGDFPPVVKYRRALGEIKDISKFNRLDKGLVYEMDKVFSMDIPKLMERAAINPGVASGSR